jgi:RNA polymerase sigma-70 factor (ECF subfamily)
MEPATFRDLIQRVRAGDEQAGAELVQRYEPAIRVAVRVRLTSPQLRRLFDSMDVCQSVLGDFFHRVQAGQFELDRPDQLLKLLSAMARNKLTNLALKQRAARRDYRRLLPGLLDDSVIADASPSPSRIVAERELVTEVSSRLSPQEKRLVEERLSGRPWAELALETGESPDALRMRLTRAFERVAAELSLEE